MSEFDRITDPRDEREWRELASETQERFAPPEAFGLRDIRDHGPAGFSPAQASDGQRGAASPRMSEKEKEGRVPSSSAEVGLRVLAETLRAVPEAKPFCHGPVVGRAFPKEEK